MKSQKTQAFLKSIREDIPQVKLLKYRYFIEKFDGPASEIKADMLKIALDNNLLGQYRNIFEFFKQSIQYTQTYQEMNQKMVSQIDPLHHQEKQYRSQQNTQKLAQVYLKIGSKYFQYGDYKNSVDAYEALNSLNQNNHNVKYSDYANEWAIGIYYRNQFYNLARFNSRPIQKAALQKMLDLCVLRDIDNIQTRKNMDDPFKNLIEMGFGNEQVSKNRAMSYNDLGFLYSMLTIAYKKKDKIKFVKWSNKLENQYLNNNYKTVLQTLQKQKEIRSFLPIIRKLYEQCHSLIKKRIIVEVVSAFDRCPFKIIEDMTGINEGQVRIFVKNNIDVPFLFDPVTSSVVYKRATAPLYKQVNRLYQSLMAKYQEEFASLNMKPDMNDDDDDDFGLGSFDRKRSGGRMGGMGGMGGMGMRRHH